MSQNVEILYKITTQGEQDLKNLAAAQRENREQNQASNTVLQQTDAATRKAAEGVSSLAAATQNLASKKIAPDTEGLDATTRKVNEAKKAMEDFFAENAKISKSKLQDDSGFEKGKAEAQAYYTALTQIEQLVQRSQLAELSGLEKIAKQRELALQAVRPVDTDGSLRGKIDESFKRLSNVQAVKEETDKQTAAERALAAELARVGQAAQTAASSQLTAEQQIEAQRQRALATLGKTDASIRQINAAYDTRQAVRAQTDLEHATQRVADLVKRSQEAELTGLQRIEAERRRVLAESGRTPQLRSQINQTFDTQRSQQLSGLGQTVQNAVQNPFGALAAGAGQFAEALGPVGIGLSALALGLGIAVEKSIGLVQQQGKLAEALGNTAERLGLSTAQVEQLSAAAAITGVNFTSIEAAARILAIGLEEPAGAGKKTAEALGKLNIALFDFKGNTREIGPVVLEVLESLSKIESTSERVALAQRTLGRGSKELLPLITNYQELKRVVGELKIGLDDDLNKSLQKTDDEFDKLGLAFNRLKKELAVPIGKIIIPFVQTITQQLTGGETPGQKALKEFGPVAVGVAAGLPGSTQLLDLFLNSAKQADDHQAAENNAKIAKLTSDSKNLSNQKTVLEQALTLKTVQPSDIAPIQKKISDLDALLKSTEDTRAQLERLGTVAQKSKPVATPDAALSRANQLVTDEVKRQTQSAKAEDLKSKEGLEERKRELQKQVGELKVKQRDPGFTDLNEREKVSADKGSKEAELKQVEAQIKAISKAESDRGAVTKAIDSFVRSANEFQLSSIERIQQKTADFILKLKEEHGLYRITADQLARINAAKEKEIGLEKTRQGENRRAAELPLLERKATLDLEPEQELAAIKAVFDLRLQNAALLSRDEDKRRAIQASEIEREAALLELLKQQKEAREKTQLTFALAEATGVSEIRQRQIANPSPRLPFNENADQERVLSQFAERKDLINQEFDVRKKREGETIAGEQRALDLINARKDLELGLLDARRKKEQELVNLQAEALRTRLDRRVALTQVLGSPLDERATLDRVHNLKLQYAQDEFARTQNQADLAKRLDEAEFDRVQKLVELRRHELDAFRENAGRLFDALEQRGKRGLQDFAQGFLKTIERTIFQNLSSLAFGAIRDNLPKIGGQSKETIDANGQTVREKTLLGKILSGTPFAEKVDPQKELGLKLDSNGSALKESTSAALLVDKTMRGLAGVISRLEDRLGKAPEKPEVTDRLTAADKLRDTPGVASGLETDERQRQRIEEIAKAARAANPVGESKLDLSDLDKLYQTNREITVAALTPVTDSVQGLTEADNRLIASLDALRTSLPASLSPATSNTTGNAAATPQPALASALNSGLSDLEDTVTETLDKSSKISDAALTTALDRVAKSGGENGKLLSQTTSTLGLLTTSFSRVIPALSGVGAGIGAISAVISAADRTNVGRAATITDTFGKSAIPAPSDVLGLPGPLPLPNIRPSRPSATGQNTATSGGLGGLLSGLSHTGDFTGIFTGISNTRNGAESLTGAERLGGALGTAGVLAAGFAGISSSLKQGGARGGLGAASAALGTAAALDQEPISKAVLAAGAVLTSLVKGFLPDPKKVREKEISNELLGAQQAAQPFKESGVTITLDSRTGRAVDHDFRGNLRVLDSTPSIENFRRPFGFNPDHPGTSDLLTAPDRRAVNIPDVDLPRSLINALSPAPRDFTPSIQRTVENSHQTVNQFSVTLPVHAMDSQDVLRRSGDIASAVSKELFSTHRLGTDIKSLVRPF